MNRPGEVTAYLAGVEERSRQTLSGTQSFGHGATMQASAADVPRLLKAVRAALAHHVHAVIEDMPDPFHYCETCSGHPAWPCPEVQAITRELLGKGE